MRETEVIHVIVEEFLIVTLFFLVE